MVGIARTLWWFLSSRLKPRERLEAENLALRHQLNLVFRSPRRSPPFIRQDAPAKAGDDAALLAAAYTLASSGGWEDDPGVYQWLHRAAELSGDDGPIQKVSLQDVLDRKPEWERRESETWELLSRGDIPMFMAAQALNRALSN